MSSSPDALTRPPERIGPYRLEERLGAGGMGEVYRAYDERLDRKVAIKHILPEAAEDVKIRERLRREARSVAQLNHPAIVQIYDIVESDAGDWVVMELIEGPTLHRLIEHSEVSMRQALHLGIEVADGLAEAHGQGIVHRDLKTENVMIGRSGRAKILDFGLAKNVWSTDDTALSIQGSIVGTGRAMSPEQAKGEEIDARSDIFSLGSLLYETLTGKPPFLGTSIIHTLAQVVSERHVSARDLNPDIPAELSDYLDRMLEKDRNLRPQSTVEVAATLTEFLSMVEPDAAAGLRPGFPPTSATMPTSDETTFIDRASAAGREASLQEHRPAPSTAATGVWRATTSSGFAIRTLVMVAPAPPTPGSMPDDVSGPSRRLTQESASELRATHDRLARSLLLRYEAAEVDKSDAFLFLFERPLEAVRFVLGYHQTMTEELPADSGMAGCASIHLGEILLRENRPEDVTQGAPPFELEGDGKLFARRLLDLAQPGQTLLTREAFDVARRSLVGSQSSDDRPVDGGLRWQRHGTYRFEGLDEEVAVYEVGELDSATPAPPAETRDARRVDRAEPAPAGSSWLKPVASVASVASVVAVLLVALLALRGEQSGPTAGEVQSSGETRASVAVFSFRNLSRQPEVDWLSTALAEMLSTDLASSDSLRLVPGESVARVHREVPEVKRSDTLEATTLARVRQNLGSDFVVMGSFVSQGAQLRLQVKVQDTRDGRVVASLSQQGDDSELFDLVSRASGDLRARLGISERTQDEAESVRAALSQSPEATRLYAEGLDHLRNFDTLGARDLLLRAIAADPEHTKAHAALSQAWAALGYDGESASSAQRAHELRDGLPPQERLWIEAHFFEAGKQWDEAISKYKALWELYPDNIEYGLRVAAAQAASGSGRDALSSLEALRLLPPPAGEDVRIDLAEAAAQDVLGEHSAVLAAADQAATKARRQGSPTLLAEALLWRGRMLRFQGLDGAEEALGEARRLFTEAGDRGSVARVLKPFALWLDTQGDVDGAEALYEQAIEIHRETGNRKEEADNLNQMAYLVQGRGGLAAARQMLEDAIEVARELDSPYSEALYGEYLVWVLLGQGALDAARDVAQRVGELYGLTDNAVGVGWSFYYRGEIALARGRAIDARTDFDLALQVYQDHDDAYLGFWVLLGLGKTELELDELDSSEQRLEQAREMAQGYGDNEALGEIEIASARLALARGAADAALQSARQASVLLAQAQKLDREVVAGTILARALLAAGDQAAARAELEALRGRVTGSESPITRLHGALAEARLEIVDAAVAQASTRLRTAADEASRFGLAALELELRVVGLELGGEEASVVAAACDSLGMRRLAREAGHVP